MTAPVVRPSEASLEPSVQSRSASGGFQNLANTFYLITFESVFSGTTLGRPRSYSGRLSWRFQ